MNNISPHIFSVIFLSSSFILCGIVNAEMYKWIDSEGKTHYSQSRPVDNVTVETIKPPSSVNTEDAVKALEKRVKTVNEARDERIKTKEEQQKAEEETAKKEQKCQQARDRLLSYQQRPRVNVVNPDGSKRILSEDERQLEINKSKDNINTFCK
tara:strand:- start:11472 stop:11933 length:462 start_codon:yes stop_codon:yes gene_type:complete